MDLNPSPFFPPELERDIFETSAYLYPQTIRNLVRVSRRVHEWIDGMQYTTVMDTNAEGHLYCPEDALLRVIQSESKAASFFQRHVRHVYHAWRDRDNMLAPVLSACSGIHNLVLCIRPPTLETLLPTLAAMRPRRLALSRKPSLDSHAPMFTFLTHFHILSSSLPADAGALPSFLAHLPALTHFAIGSQMDGTTPTNLALAREILAECKTLEVLILEFYNSNSLAPFLPSVYDPRFLYQWFQARAFIDGWVAELEGGIDFWARGDAFIAKKLRGEIQPVSRCWIDVRDGIPDVVSL
ncbi:hypothetical protein C8R45DRAFT_1215368 [Mycena sanguinolenta]|nr:hypothetical protein C8R45DRAFT_1215368 [Mycena sanguinolenta]